MRRPAFPAYNGCMSKPYPEMIALKKSKCPSCGHSLDRGELRRDESVVRVGCGGKGCGYSMDLFWLGGATVSAN